MRNFISSPCFSLRIVGRKIGEVWVQTSLILYSNQIDGARPLAKYPEAVVLHDYLYIFKYRFTNF